MKTTQTRLADLWCRLMHTEPMWPAHGTYECRTCGRRYRVCWEQPSPARLHVAVLPREMHAQRTMVAAIESRIQCSL